MFQALGTVHGQGHVSWRSELPEKQKKRMANGGGGSRRCCHVKQGPEKPLLRRGH